MLTAFAVAAQPQQQAATADANNATLRYVEFRCKVKGATISINDAAPEPFVDGKFGRQLPSGTYRYTVEAPMYYQTSGVKEVTAQNITPVAVKLKPKFGKLTINTQPEQGADIFIDGKKRGQSPLVVELSSGKHVIRAEKDLFLPISQEKNVADGSTSSITLSMTPTTAYVTLTAGGGADIYINDEKMATSRWSGSLAPGEYRAEARKPSHRTSSVTFACTAGQSKTVALATPKPIYGLIDVKSENVRATIFIDGKRSGTTPAVVKNVLTGSRDIELRANGYIPYLQTVTVEEGKTLSVAATLQREDSVGSLVVTANTKAKISVQGEEVGYTPITVENLPLVKTEVLFEAPGYKSIMGVGTVAPGKTRVDGVMEVVPAIMLTCLMSPPTSYLGFSAGYCKNIGGYLQYRADWQMEEKANLVPINEDFKGGKRRYFRSSFTAGGILRLSDYVWIYGGLGHGKYGAVYQEGVNRALFSAGLIKGLEMEFGVTGRVWKIFTVSAGYSTIARSNFGEMHFGVGILIPIQ